MDMQQLLRERQAFQNDPRSRTPGSQQPSAVPELRPAPTPGPLQQMGDALRGLFQGGYDTPQRYDGTPDPDPSVTMGQALRDRVFTLDDVGPSGPITPQSLAQQVPQSALNVFVRQPASYALQRYQDQQQWNAALGSGGETMIDDIGRYSVRYPDGTSEDMPYPIGTMEDIMAFAGLATGGGLSGRALRGGIDDPNSVGMFYRPKKVDVAVAEVMEKAGYSPADIWKNVGVSRSFDGGWRAEFNTTKAKIKDFEPGSAGKLPDYLDFDDLYDEYPELRDLNVVVPHSRTGANYGSYDPATNTIMVAPGDEATVRRGFLHEVQHAIQTKEGWAAGTNTMVESGPARQEFLENRIRPGLEEIMGKEYADDVFSRIKRGSELYPTRYKGVDWARVDEFLREAMKEHPTDGFERYLREAGEVEARNTEERDFMRSIVKGLGGERLYPGPAETESVPRAQQYARYPKGGGQPSMSQVLRPLPGAPTNHGPDARLTATAERYARSRGIDLRRQSEYVDIDEDFARAIADEYDRMPHAPDDPAVKRSYEALGAETMDQYDFLVEDGYKFKFFDPEGPDPYEGQPGGFANPWNAMRDLRDNQTMTVYPTNEGFGTLTDTVSHPLLADTGLRWEIGDTGKTAPVTFNDLFRAVHDAMGHGIEGSGFRARGEENAWQAHARLFSDEALPALTSETRGQNSWLNYGPHGEANQTAQVGDTVFADQKAGLMPEWTWRERRAGEEPPRMGHNGGPPMAPMNMAEALRLRAEQMDKPIPQRIKPEQGTMGMVDRDYMTPSPLDHTGTTPQYPRAPEGAKLPGGNRGQLLIERKDQIAEALAQKIRDSGQMEMPTRYFYHSDGPLYRAARSAGLSDEEAQQWLRDFSKAFAATSPRTMVEPNTRNATLVMAKEAQGVPVHEVLGVGTGGVSEKGYPMFMGEGGMHRRLIEGDLNAETNTKPTMFSANTRGDRSVATIDTHAIRATLMAANELDPGSVRQFVLPKFREQYDADPSKLTFDMLDDKIKKSRGRQVEYPLYADIWHAVADKLGVSPAEAQSMGWFGLGGDTNLGSDLKTVAQVFDERLSVTAQAFGVTKEEAAEAVFRRRIPLLSGGGAGAPVMASAVNQEEE